MQINLSNFIQQSLSNEQLSAQLLKNLGYDGFSAEGLSLSSLFGSPGNSVLSSSAGHDIEQVRGWNQTAIVAKSLQFALGNVGVFCPLWTAEAISFHYGKEYAAASRFTGTEQYGVPSDWVEAPAEHKISRLMRKPNPWSDEAHMLFQMCSQIETHGVCYFLVLPNPGGQPQQMYVIPRALIQPKPPSVKFPEGSYQVGNLSRQSMMTRLDRNPESYVEQLAWMSNREYSANFIIPVGLPSLLYCDDYMNISSGMADALDTDTTIHRSRRGSLEKQLTSGPRLEQLPGTDYQAGERDKILEQFEADNQGPSNSGRPWMPPKGIKVVDDSHTGREMEYTDSANQSRDHVLGQRLWPSAMMGLGDGGAYAQIIGIIKGTTRLVLQPLMRIFAGQLTIGFQRFFDAPQDDFIVVMQAGSIDDPEQKLKDNDFLLRAQAVTTGETRKWFNMEPFGDERDDKMAGTLGAEGQAPPGGVPGMPGAPGAPVVPTKEPAPGSQGGDIGVDKPAVGAPLGEAETKSVESQNVYGGLTRQQFVRNQKAITQTLQAFENGTMREKTALATLKTLGLSSEQAKEFVDSVKPDPEEVPEVPAAAPVAAPVAANPPEEVKAMFSRMVDLNKPIDETKLVCEEEIEIDIKPSEPFAKAHDHDEQLDKMRQRGREYASGETRPKKSFESVAELVQETMKDEPKFVEEFVQESRLRKDLNYRRSELIADILVSVYGSDVERMLADQNDMALVTKAWNPSAVIDVGTSLSNTLAEANRLIESAIAANGKTNTASQLCETLCSLSVSQLRDIIDSYGMNAVGRSHTALVMQIAAKPMAEHVKPRRKKRNVEAAFTDTESEWMSRSLHSEGGVGVPLFE